MVKHIKSNQIGSGPDSSYNIQFLIDGRLYKAFNISSSDYAVYKKQLEFGGGYKAINFLKSKKYEITNLDSTKPSDEEKNEVHTLIQQFLRDLEHRDTT
jgi:hypothetical protein